MNKVRLLSLLLVSTAVSVGLFSTPAEAARRPKPNAINAKLKAVCPKIVDINERLQFYKNNKPMRASSAINAPVIGYFKQMTLANNAGYRNSIGSSAVTMYDNKGGILTRMIPYACRADHCGGRVVSNGATDTTRRIAVSRTGSPKGFIKVSTNTCVQINDIGRCYGNEVDKTRPLCNQTVD